MHSNTCHHSLTAWDQWGSYVTAHVETGLVFIQSVQFSVSFQKLKTDGKHVVFIKVMQHSFSTQCRYGLENMCLVGGA